MAQQQVVHPQLSHFLILSQLLAHFLRFLAHFLKFWAHFLNFYTHSQIFSHFLILSYALSIFAHFLMLSQYLAYFSKILHIFSTCRHKNEGYLCQQSIQHNLTQKLWLFIRYTCEITKCICLINKFCQIFLQSNSFLNKISNLVELSFKNISF